MKKILIFILLPFGVAYSQLKYNLEERPFKEGGTYVGWIEKIPNGDKLIFGNSYIDKEGNILGALPNITDGSFDFTSAGCYITYKPSKTSYDTRTVYITNDKLGSLSGLAGEPEVVIAKLKPSKKIVKESTCYKNYSSGIFYNTNTKNEVVYLDHNFVHLLEGTTVKKSIEIYNPGKRLDYGFTDDCYYGLFASEKSLSVIKVNLEDGSQEIKVLKDKHQNYSGGEFKIEGDKIHVVSFYGDCSYNFMANAQMTKGDGLICMTINTGDLSIESEAETELPDDYQKLFSISNDKVTDPKVLTIYQNGSDLFVATSNGAGMVGSQTAIVGPMLVWKMKDNELQYMGALGGVKSTYPTSATFFTYNNKDYLIYSCTYTYDSYKENINLIDITDGISDNSVVHMLDLNKENVDFYFNGASSVYLTSGGKLMFVGKGKNYQSVLYLKIDIPS